MGSEQQFCLRWHNYQSSLLASLPQLLDGDDLTDVTLMAGGCNLKAHRVVLSACSQYFKELFKVLQPLQHPVIVLPGAKFSDLCALVTFMYSGEVKIYQDQLQGLLSMADALQIRGLAEVNSNPAKSAHSDSMPPQQNASPSRKRARSNLPPDTIATQSPPEANFKQPDNDVYASMMRALTGSKHCSEESDAHYSSYDRHSTYIEHFDSANVNRRNIREKYPAVDDISLLGVNEPAIENRIKTELERVDDIMPELNSVMKSSQHGSLEDTEMPVSKMYEAGDDHSPSSNDSTHDGGFTSFNADADRMQSSSSGTNLAKLTSTSSSQYVYQACGQIIGNSKLFATCFVCGKQLSNQYNLRVHMETHQNVNYACTVCSHVSRSRDALRKHVSYRHPTEAKGGSSTEAQVGGEGASGKFKKSKVVPNKDSNNNKRTNP